VSEVEASLPSRAAVMSVIGTLEALRPEPAATSAALPQHGPAPAALPTSDPAAVTAPAPAAPSVQARHDQDAAALREMTAERDAWRTEATSLRHELGQQLELIREATTQYHAIASTLHAELEQHREQLDLLRADAQARDEQNAHLSTAITALIDLARGRVEAAAAAPHRPAPNTADDVPRSQPPAPVATTAAPMVIPGLAPDRPVVDQPRLGVTPVKLVERPVAPTDQAAAPPPFQAGPQPTA
jgi:hypothetical protein